MKKEDVLVVDDKPVNLKLLKVLLEAEGYRVGTAMDAQEAIASVQAHPPGLILMDIQLPGVDGLELTRRFRSDPATEGICIVAVTSYAMKGDEEKILEAGCNGYIAKPIDTRTLTETIRKHLDAHHEQERSS